MYYCKRKKDSGVTINADTKVSEQCGNAASKGNRIIGLIRRNIAYIEKNIITPMYKSIVRPRTTYKLGYHVVRRI